MLPRLKGFQIGCVHNMPYLQSEGLAFTRLNEMIIMIEVACFTRLNPDLFCPISFGARDRL